MLWHCRLGDRKDIRPVKSWMLVCCWWWFDWSFTRLIAPVVTTTSTSLTSNRIQNQIFWNWLTQVHQENGRQHGVRENTNDTAVQCSAAGNYLRRTSSTFTHHTHCSIDLSLSLSLSLCFNGHLPGEPGLAGVYWSKGWWRWWWQLDYWSYKSCKPPVKSSPPTNQHPVSVLYKYTADIETDWALLTMSSILRMLRTVSADRWTALNDTSSGWTTFSSRMFVIAP